MKRNFFAGIMSIVLLLTLAGCGSNAATEYPTSQAPESSMNTEKPTNSDTKPESSSAKNAGSESAAPSDKTLVVYFSWSGNTKSVATEIATQTGADTFEIVPETPYTDDYNTLLDVAQQEQKDGARPKISGTIENFDQYDTVFVGFPNWWGDMPMILYTFFDSYDLSGKTVVPFVTSGGSGFSNTVSAMEKLEPKATFLDGLALGSSEAKSPADAVTKWLVKIGQ